MTKLKFLALVPLLSALSAPAVQAQVTIDVAKITCEQFMLFKVTDPRYIAIWLSGYYNGKRDNTVIDPQALEQNAQKVKDYCIRNLGTTVMKAVEATLPVPR